MKLLFTTSACEENGIQCLLLLETAYNQLLVEGYIENLDPSPAMSAMIYLVRSEMGSTDGELTLDSTPAREHTKTVKGALAHLRRGSFSSRSGKSA